jgi:acetylglutamate synthase
MTEQPIHKHDCECCKFLGTDSLYEAPVDIYFCDMIEELPPSILVRFSNEPSDYSSLDVKSLFSIASNPVTKTNVLMLKYLKNLTLEQARVLN